MPLQQGPIIDIAFIYNDLQIQYIERVALEYAFIWQPWSSGNFWDADVQKLTFSSAPQPIKNNPTPCPSSLTLRSNERMSSSPLRPDPSRNIRWVHDIHAQVDLGL